MESCHSVEEEHSKFLDDLCRICMKKVQTREQKRSRRLKLCVDYEKELLTVFGVNISQDVANVHPKGLCHQCLRQAQKTKQRTLSDTTLESFKTKAQEVNWKWRPHQDGFCEICASASMQQRGGRQRKQKTVHKPKSKVEQVENQKHFQPKPVMTPSPAVNGIFCASTPLSTFPARPWGHCASFDTPYMDTRPHMIHNSSAYRSASTNAGTQTTPKSEKSIQDSLNRSMKSPLDKVEERLHTKLTKRKLNFSQDKTTIQCKTGGPVSNIFMNP